MTSTDTPAHFKPLPPSCTDGASVAWMTVCAVLVLGMMPALGLFEAGLLREQNFVHILTQVFTGVAILGMLWFIVGYSLVFGDSYGGWIGDPMQFLAGRGLRLVEDDSCFSNTTVPIGLHFLYQMMFAAITPLLITGASAERILFRPSVWFTVLFEILVYYPVAHWIWNPDGWLFKLGVRDFAGGIVIHATAGVSSILLAILLGRREIFERLHGMVRPSSVPTVVAGGMLLWLGWFAFNGGSALAAWSDTVTAVLNTQLASCGGAVAALLISSTLEQPNAVALLNGAIAGLAGITPAAGYVEPWVGMVIGFVCGCAFVASEHLIIHHLGVDDALGVSAVHGVPGVIGALATGIAAAHHLDGVDPGLAYGGGPKLLQAQVIGLGVAVGVAAVATVAIYFFLMLLFDGKVSAVTIRSPAGVPADAYGLDAAEHGMCASFFEPPAYSEVSPLQALDSSGAARGNGGCLVDAPYRSFLGRLATRRGGGNADLPANPLAWQRRRPGGFGDQHHESVASGVRGIGGTASYASYGKIEHSPLLR